MLRERAMSQSHLPHPALCHLARGRGERAEKVAEFVAADLAVAVKLKRCPQQREGRHTQSQSHTRLATPAVRCRATHVEHAERQGPSFLAGGGGLRGGWRTEGTHDAQAVEILEGVDRAGVVGVDRGEQPPSPVRVHEAHLAAQRLEAGLVQRPRLDGPGGRHEPSLHGVQHIERQGGRRRVHPLGTP
eukprot:COSAG06_NODE_12344_length_1392_cov_1.060325_2_plen_188_part_00